MPLGIRHFRMPSPRPLAPERQRVVDERQNRSAELGGRTEVAVREALPLKDAEEALDLIYQACLGVYWNTKRPPCRSLNFVQRSSLPS